MQDETRTQASEGIGTILVADDELKNRELLHDLLEVKGHEIVEAENGEEALAKVAACAPDAILLDVMMPGMDGFEVCRRLKADPATAPIPVLLVTALKEREDKLEGIGAGASDFLTKPIDPQEVVLRTRNAVFAKKLYDKVQESYERLKELEALRDNLTHMIVHDLRSPLTGIMGFLQLFQLTATDELEGELGEFVQKSLSSCSTLLEMISSLLDVNRLESGEMPLNRTLCDLRTLVEEALKTLGATVKVVRLAVKLPAAPVYADCDPEVVRRVIVNLVSNAIRFTPDDGDVSVAVQDGPERVRVSVVDSGRGIPPDCHKKIFEKFGQVAARSENKKYSTGLGLTFCKLAVEAHGGAIGLESEEGKGSTFWFELPTRPGPEPSQDHDVVRLPVRATRTQTGTTRH